MLEIGAEIKTEVKFEPKFYFILIGGFCLLGVAILMSALIRKSS